MKTERGRRKREEEQEKGGREGEGKAGGSPPRPPGLHPPSREKNRERERMGGGGGRRMDRGKGSGEPPEDCQDPGQLKSAPQHPWDRYRGNPPLFHNFCLNDFIMKVSNLVKS